MMNLTQAVNGIPLVGIVLALVQWIKGFGLSGKKVRVISMIVGLVLGFLYQLSLGVPADFTGWFVCFVFGLVMGLTASGTYDALNGKSNAAG
jgi:FtsH-binding integral membrane protein